MSNGPASRLFAWAVPYLFKYNINLVNNETMSWYHILSYETPGAQAIGCVAPNLIYFRQTLYRDVLHVALFLIAGREHENTRQLQSLRNFQPKSVLLCTAKDVGVFQDALLIGWVAVAHERHKPHVAHRGETHLQSR